MDTELCDEFEKAVKLIKFILYWCAINLFGEIFEEKKWKKRVRRILSIIIMLSPISALAALVCNIHDYIKIIESIFTISGFFQAALKYVILKSVLDCIVQFVEKCRMFRRNQALDIERASDKFNCNKIIARPTLVIKILLLFLLLTLLVVFTAPLIRSQRNLPVPLYLVFLSPMESPFYEINYVFIIVVLFVSAMFILGVEAVLFSFVSEVCLQMNVITYKLSTLGDNEEDDQRSKIREICQLHWEITSLTKDLNNIFSNLLLVQFSTSFIMISTALFMFVTKDNYAFLVCAVFLTIQLGLYCIYGEIVKDKFEKLLFTLYNNQWYNLNSSEKKSLNIMMSFAQAVPTLKAVGYVELSMETYFQILKTAYSYLAIMQNIQPDK